jgi:hypothetical protein
MTLFGSAASAQPAQQAVFGATQSFGLFGAPAVSAPALSPPDVSVDPALMQGYVRDLSSANDLPLPEDEITASGVRRPDFDISGNRFALFCA